MKLVRDTEVNVAEAGDAGSDSTAGAGPHEDATLKLDPATACPSPEFLALVPHEYARRHLVLSAGCRDGLELLLVSEQTRPSIPFNIGVRLGRSVLKSPAAGEAIAAAVDRCYAQAQVQAPSGPTGDAPVITVEGANDVERELDQALREAEQDLLSTAGKAPAVRLVDLVLFEALLRGASDVHIQPVRAGTLVRYRLDGTLHTVRQLPAALASSVVSRIKVMGRMDVAEHRAAQDGRATVTIGGSGGGSQQGRRIDLRISSLPSTYGERLVLRILDPSQSPHLKTFSTLGMPPAVEQQYLRQASKSNGIVLSTGPTGSGKTTTLYTTLAWISSTNAGASSRGCELNMMTIEDPVEYDLSGAGLSVSQTQVDPKKNVTFVTGLRHILRQDPDVIMVGEIRDQETARIAVQASLTGHLVLSTLHTNDAASAVARLIDLGVEPFLVSSSLTAVLAQRLVRTLHQPCGGAGCGPCMSTGYKGRTGVFELLVVDGSLRELIGRHVSAIQLKEAAQRGGMVTLRQEGQRLVREGITTAREVARVIEALDEDQLKEEAPTT